MARTGARALALSHLLSSAGFESAAKPATLRITELAQPEVEQAIALYRELGGIQSPPNIRPGGWDLAVTAQGERLVIELDEELHFNRYRALTLRAPWYRNVEWAHDYSEQCRRHERRCLDAGSWGKRWTNPSCEQFFGAPGSPGQIAGRGAPRWKQRALYDAIKDLAAVSGAGPRLARLSINDNLGGRTLESFLAGPASVDPVLLRDLVDRRMLG